MRIAVLALQGAFAEHERALARLGVPCVEIRRKSDLFQPFDGLILPGGESTVQGKFLRDTGMLEEIRTRIERGMPVFGTCAGLLLLAKDNGSGESTYLRTMDIRAVRNAYGRQLGSFHAEERFGRLGKIPMTFIRAPYIGSVGAGVETLASCGGHIVAARQGRQLVTAFHPELTDDLSVHAFFLRMAGA